MRVTCICGLRDNHRFNTASGGTKSFMSIGDVVLIQDDNQPRTLWKLGRIEEIFTGSDGSTIACTCRK